RTVTEFWGVRWNSIISTGLRRNFFKPFARRRQAWLGALLAFGASGLGHFYMTLPAAGLMPALWVAAFFLAHGVIAIVEARLGVARWSNGAARAFTACAFVVTLPLMGEGLMRGLGL